MTKDNLPPRVTRALYDALIQGNCLGQRIELEKDIDLLILQLTHSSSIWQFLTRIAVRDRKPGPKEPRDRIRKRYLRIAGKVNDWSWTPPWVLNVVRFLLARRLARRNNNNNPQS